MVKTTLTKSFVGAFSALVTLLTLGSAFAGSPDYSKGKAVVQPAPVCDPRWYISIGGGLDFDYGATDFVNGLDSNVDSFGVRILGRDYNDVYDNTLYRIQGEVGYVLNPHVELFAMFKYAGGYGYTQYGDNVDLFFPSPRNVYNFPVTTYFSDYKSWGGELGLRWFFITSKEPWHIRPYISISGGANFVESISVKSNFNYFGDGFTLFDGTFYDDSVVGTGALLLGFEVPLSCHFYVGMDAGVRYESQLYRSSDFNKGNFFSAPGLPGQTQFNKINHDAGDRLYCPVTVYAKFRF